MTAPSAPRSAGEPAPEPWPGRDGLPVSCLEKLRVLEENEAELRQAMQDAFEDALLIGVDETALRARLHRWVDALRGPGR
jgi:hypothetical protein